MALKTKNDDNDESFDDEDTKLKSYITKQFKKFIKYANVKFLSGKWSGRLRYLVNIKIFEMSFYSKCPSILKSHPQNFKVSCIMCLKLEKS